MASRKVLGTTATDAPLKPVAKFDAKELQKAEKIAEAFYKENDIKSLHPFALEKQIADFVAKSGNKKLKDEIEYVVFQKYSRKQ